MDYTLLERREFPADGMTGLWYRHACGMEVVSIERDDVENMFCIGLATSPEDDCGTAHIIEHSVLAGSVHYPVHDPFMEMIKGSVATFINALTYHDHTIYPVASAVPKDFFNLASVYFDAVFNPLLTRQTFQQEGWHYEFAKDGRLQRNGVVLNEMAGTMDDIDEIVEVEVNRRLFPETSRRFLSGGHPDRIGRLSYRKYLDYYRRHYHPSRARVYFYGNIPTDEKLAFLDGLLEQLPEHPAPEELPMRKHQRRWTAPKRGTVHFTPPDGGDGAWAQAFFLTDEWDPLADLAFEFLDELLIGNDSSPLRQAIQESGLCDSLAVSGYDNETLDTAFLIAANGVPKANFRKLEKLVGDTLRSVAEHGFTERQLKASMTQFKTARREVTSSYVYRKMEGVFDLWCYGLDPFLYMDADAMFSRFEKRLQDDPEWLKRLVRECLFDNTHRLTLRFVPDAQLHERRVQADMRHMEALGGRMSERTRRRIDEEARELRKIQGMPNSPEVLATLPKLWQKDVPDRPVLLKTAKSSLGNGTELLDVDCFTNGLSYMEMLLPVGSLELEDLRVADTFYNALFRRVGTAVHSHSALDEELAECGGGLGCSKIFWLEGDALKVGLCFAARALDEHFPRLLELLRECLEQTVFTESAHIHSRIRQMALAMRENIAQGSLTLAATRAASGLSPLWSLREYTGGLSSARTVKDVSLKFSAQWPKLKARLEAIEGLVAGLTPSLAAFEGSEKTRAQAVEFLESFTAPIQNSLSRIDFGNALNGRCEGLANGGDVSSCARLLKGPRYTDADSVPLSVYLNILSCGHLYEEVRLKGGAYDVNCGYYKDAGLVTFYSGSDPQPWRTREVFDGLPNVGGFSEEDVRKAVLSTVKGGFAPIRADRALPYSISRHLLGITNDMTIERFKRFMSLTAKDIKEAAERFWAGRPERNDCLIGPASALRKAQVDFMKL